ncbi:flagellar hook-associated protein FlgK [Fundidesulfovibrio agrisoli]|uniref:flagellar hook-associated protein FlgK n=1 Tax=Fundidesulfovibrio agrisoli TaxID=2922717 RepID=UPI001FAD1511|nr:flagellar hook-associated protein FlgK [Fundidesulfovibrio agrisoli]
MAGITSLLNTGMKALNASQIGIEVTGQNIANVNTVGYSRQRVVYKDDMYIDSSPGQMGTGVKASEIVRMFDQYIEQAYNLRSSSSQRYNVLYQNMQSVETTFNESSNDGISKSLASFFQDWQNLSLDPSNYPQRQNILSDAQNLMSILRQSAADLDDLQRQTEASIADDVTAANNLVKDIAAINQQIAVHDDPGNNNANGLYDQRAIKVRALAQLMDIKTIDNGGGNFTVLTGAGHTLVDGGSAFDLKLENGKVTRNLLPGSDFNGTVGFSGSDSFEYTIRVVQGGVVSNGNPAAQFQVSLDGGVTWLRSDSGAIKTFSARPQAQSVGVGNLSIYFGAQSNAGVTPTGTLQAGDTFTVVPKTALYWYQSASTPVNITPQTYFNGQDNTSRLTGGSLAGEFELRDYNIGRYKERLESLANSLIWETNRIHSQGSGLTMFNDTTGTYQVRNANLALGSDASGLAYGSKLSAGASTLYVYNSATGACVSNGFLDFDPAQPGTQLFDPTKHSLNDVVNAINNTFGSFLTASVSNNKLQIDSKPGYSFGFGTDSTGLYAALGVNTFFDGSDIHTMTLNPLVGSNTNFVNAGHINGASESNPGDNTTAKALAELANKNVTIRTSFDAPTSQSLGDYYNSLVGVVGVDTEKAKFNYDFENSLATELNNRQLAVSGVNLDEEMSNLVKFQHSYQAAAKMISTADQMWQTVLGLKQ